VGDFRESEAHGLPVNSAKHVALVFLGGKVQSEILRSALQKLDALLVSIEQLGPSLSDPS
jgi:hypothetical protein